MASEQTLQQKTVLRNIITQQQLRFVAALEKNAREFDQEVDKELEENSALEAEPDPGHEEVRLRESHANTYYPNLYSGSEDRPEFTPRDDSETLYDYLRTQLYERTLPPAVKEAALYLIDSLEPDGYLRRNIADLREDMMFHHGLKAGEADLREALTAIKGMDPAGVGASSLQECLRLQLERMSPNPERDNALRIVNKKFDALTSRHYHKIISGLKMPEDTLRRALDLIVSLNPRPGLAIGNSSEEATNVVIPDFIISEDSDTGEMSIILNNRIPELKISESFASAVRELEAGQKRRKAGKTPENQYILSHFNEASDFIKIFRQRQQTLYTVMSAIVKLQKDYFSTADIYSLHPMMLKDLERETGLDKSTISRATKNKFVDLPWGTYPLKFFFSDSKGSKENSSASGSAALTNRKIEAEIRKIIEAEDKRHPLSDAAIFKEMQARGLDIARRTVTKYRERCGIPASRLRRQ